MEDLVNDSINNDEDHSLAVDSALRIVINVTHDNDIVEQLIQDKATLKKLCGWLTHSDDVLDGKGADLVVCAALCLGNLSRSELGLLGQRLPVHPAAHAYSHVCHNAKIHLATLSALRHFSMPAENKVVLGQLGITEVVMPYMLSPVADVALTAVVIHRLLSGDARSMRTMTMTTSATRPKSSLQVALDAYAKHADQVAIKCEIGRLVGALIKSAVTHNAPTALPKSRRRPLIPLWNLLTLPYVAVYNEAVLALALVLTKGENARISRFPRRLQRMQKSSLEVIRRSSFARMQRSCFWLCNRCIQSTRASLVRLGPLDSKRSSRVMLRTSPEVVENLRKLLSEVL
ncbi:hypothetical protein BCR44DRAFT_1281444 [Catenaria anguillulae PL171]|uniref:Armadillo-type protein n=1 Tax=Catenaria anguillulae PL171 TaxID=765915 RepID=A0A1Y2I024_9FUNG|nr:hypothetical protein BCR44DRAFT_1281444 [Catenaria anguillulae PL171]